MTSSFRLLLRVVIVVAVVENTLVEGQAQGAAILINKMATGDMHSLLRRIFTHYDKEVMPTRPVLVHLDVLLLRVKSTVEKEGIFESVVALFVDWHDRRMMWNESQYDNISLLAFDSEKVWLPDIALTNSADHLYSISRDFRFVVRVTSDGHLKYVPTGTARTWCSLRLLTFPFDLQTCSLEFESWSLEADTLQFDANGHLVVDPSFGSNQWHLCNYTSTIYNHTYDFTGETFARIKFDFTVRRKSTFYMLNIVFPCATLSLIQLLVFIIPSYDTTSDRIGFGTTNLLTLVVFQTIATEEMPKTSDAVTSLSKYIIALIILASCGIFESVIVERLLRIVSQPPPRCVVALSKLVPIFWREKESIQASNCTDEILARHLMSFGEINQSRQANKADWNCDKANCASRPQYFPQSSRHRYHNYSTGSGHGWHGWLLKFFLRRFGSRNRKKSVASSNHGNSFCDYYCNNCDWFNDQDCGNASSLPSPLWTSPKQKPQVFAYDEENVENNEEDGEGEDDEAMLGDEIGPPHAGDDDQHFVMNSTRSRQSSSHRNARQRRQSCAGQYFNNDLNFVDYCLPETQSQVEAALERPSLLGKPPNQRRIIFAARRLQQQRNSLMWAEIVTRLDIASFTICTLCAVFIPLKLFAPLVSDSECPEGGTYATVQPTPLPSNATPPPNW